MADPGRGAAKKAKKWKECPLCWGEGFVAEQRECPACKGSGRYPGGICHVCDGLGVVEDFSHSEWCPECGGRGWVES